jgi:hypothetical protein
MRRLLTVLAATAALATSLASTAIPAAACAGLIGSNGAVNLGRTTTLAAYHDGVEHYVTAFQFQGGGGQFGTLIPLPGIPSSVERGGGWTLQRLALETQPRRDARNFEALAAVGSVEVLLETRIDALDLTVLRGGARDVAAWATDHGFRLSPDAPEVLEFYARRSPIFLAAVFDADAAAERGQQVGDGTPIQIAIPTTNPWVPLRILGLGKQAGDRVQADVFLLTDQRPAFLPQPGTGLTLAHDAQATSRLLDDLRADDGMQWVPASSWLTKLGIDSSVSGLAYDLAVDASGQGTPSRVAAGLDLADPPVQLNAFGLTSGLALLLIAVPVAVRRLGRGR